MFEKTLYKMKSHKHFGAITVKIKSFDKAIMNEHFNIVLVFKFPIKLIEFFWSRKYFLRCFCKKRNCRDNIPTLADDNVESDDKDVLILKSYFVNIVKYIYSPYTHVSLV